MIKLRSRADRQASSAAPPTPRTDAAEENPLTQRRDTFETFILVHASERLNREGTREAR